MIQNACKPTAAPLEMKGAVPGFPLPRGVPTTDFLGNFEPSLDDLMSDEVIRRVMARDGVAADQLLTLLDGVRARLL